MTTHLHTSGHRDRGFKATVQRFGGYLAGMVMPNIGAFIAWGLITALFIPTGWIPNEDLGRLVGPMILILLPVLIGYTGGRLVHGQRGAVVGAVATIGVVVGVGHPDVPRRDDRRPLAAYLLKQFDKLTEEQDQARLRDAGRELHAPASSAARMAIVGVLRASARSSRRITDRAGDGVDWLVDHNLLPLASIIIEPAKVLFLNNAINHGVLGAARRRRGRRAGKSILFMLESNPGPGLGILLAYLFFGPRALRPTRARRDRSSSSSAASTRSTSRTS